MMVSGVDGFVPPTPVPALWFPELMGCLSTPVPALWFPELEEFRGGNVWFGCDGFGSSDVSTAVEVACLVFG